MNKQLSQHAKNAKYTSNTIQNEILACLAGMVRDEIEEVKKSKQFAVIADETKDLKKRYYYNRPGHERFLEFQEVGKLDTAGLGSLRNVDWITGKTLLDKGTMVPL